MNPKELLEQLQLLAALEKQAQPKAPAIVRTIKILDSDNNLLQTINRKYRCNT